MFKMYSTVNKAIATQQLLPMEVSYISIEFYICLVLFSDTNKVERVYDLIISMNLQMEFYKKGVSYLTLRAWSEKFH